MEKSHPIFWSFNRFRDASLIKTEYIFWEGPFSWPGFQKIAKFDTIPDIAGVYLLTFEYKDGYILRSAGVTNSMIRRFSQHKREYMSGRYTVLNINSAMKGERKEIWHGWGYAKKHQDEFLLHKDYIIKSVKDQLAAYKIFVAKIPEKRKQERIEFAIIQNAYISKEPWGDLVDGGMALRGRANSEIPIEAKNICLHKIYGVPEILEI
ncbi:MAG: hypothetical protein GF353_08995 [Candidatus Lokiarchaeota archaeon]|nr:hypothetical protein [Candidatus Lokiarchaeota archaeon]